MVLALPSEEEKGTEGVDVLAINARLGVSYVVWAYAYTEQDVFETGAVATVSVEGIGTSDVHAPRQYVHGSARFWEILRISETGGVHATNAVDVEEPKQVEASCLGGS